MRCDFPARRSGFVMPVVSTGSVSGLKSGEYIAGRKPSSQLRNAFRSSTRLMSAASVRQGERKSEPAGSVFVSQFLSPS